MSARALVPVLAVLMLLPGAAAIPSPSMTPVLGVSLAGCIVIDLGPPPFAGVGCVDALVSFAENATLP